ncbi:MAG: type II 3-dehydroquinate dehydratase [Verrucomicrobia bacterium]|nr:type II 3-dehydroquinate dehydratase [Verrucomicrobiota bacterium]
MPATKTIAILNGPNLNRLGKREPEVYGSATLDDLEDQLQAEAVPLGVNLVFYQSNHEGALIDKIAALADAGIHGIIINPGGLTHTSVVLRDALAGTGLPVIEVHLSNVHKREEFRHHSFISGIAVGVIAGLGFSGYSAALHYLVDEI